MSHTNIPQARLIRDGVDLLIQQVEVKNPKFLAPNSDSPQDKDIFTVLER